MSYIAVIGGGSWGTALAKLLAEKEFDVSMWVREENLVEDINERNVNSTYLPDAVLPESLKASNDFSYVLKDSRYVISVVPTQHTRAVMKEASQYIPEEADILSASKGIEIGTFMTVSDIMHEVTGRSSSALSGPSFAKDVCMRKPTAVTVASDSYDTALLLQEVFNTDYFRVYTHDDVKGVELGGALKNIMAIAAGLSDGLGLGYSARAALITRGLHEMTRLGTSMGAKERTFSGLSGLGDLVLTSTAPLSRNYSFGIKLAEGLKTDEILSGTTSVVEGVYTVKAAFEISGKKGVDMPIVSQMYSVIWEGKDPKRAVGDLMGRSLKTEFYE